jgi:hypothetical protein
MQRELQEVTEGQARIAHAILTLVIRQSSHELASPRPGHAVIEFDYSSSNELGKPEAGGEVELIGIPDHLSSRSSSTSRCRRLRSASSSSVGSSSRTRVGAWPIATRVFTRTVLPHRWQISATQGRPRPVPLTAKAAFESSITTWPAGIQPLCWHKAQRASPQCFSICARTIFRSSSVSAIQSPVPYQQREGGRVNLSATGGRAARQPAHELARSRPRPRRPRAPRIPRPRSPRA